jgi:hypothetical protein
MGWGMLGAAKVFRWCSAHLHTELRRFIHVRLVYFCHHLKETISSSLFMTNTT